MDIYTEYSDLGSKVFNILQYIFISQHVLQPTRNENVLDIVLSSQKECVDNCQDV